MIGAWCAWRRLAPADRRLVAESAMLLIGMRIAFMVVPAARVGRWVAGERVPSSALPAPGIRGADRVAWAVNAVSRRLPFHATCLIEALAVRDMLRRRGYVARLRLGVQHGSGMRLRAHAWVDCDGRVVVGGGEDLAAYAVLEGRGPA